MRTLLRLAALALAVCMLVTAMALEGGEVVELRTRGPDGAARVTRVWIADDGGAEWIEAASPERPFLEDVARDPDVALVRGGAAEPRRATIVAGPEGHARIRALLRRRYGWADRWIGMLADTSRSVAVRLERESPPVPAS
ncbi:MAG: hypothetical protein KIT14_21565 [bacterium]|nr:hypothetical protein [bacterium]